NPEAYRLSAIQLHTAGDPAGATALLEKALKIQPDNAMVHFNLGLLSAELNQSAKALQHLQAAVKYEPQLEDAWYNLVVYYWQMNQLPIAREKLTEALKSLPQSRRLRQLASQMPPITN
ncbi:MAG TPA: tetratricopeptide repeat protein, partial [Oceanipulchritudo sp.]|nr:tetratricopeptide repeat protein [Oceanipulchritudo sp.]